MDENPTTAETARLGWFRFSLREYIFAVVAFGVILGSIDWNPRRAYAPTSLFIGFDGRTLLDEAVAGLPPGPDGKPQFVIARGSSSTRSGGQRYDFSEYDAELEKPTADQADLIGARIFKAIGKRLATDEFRRVHVLTVTGDPKEGWVREFRYTYEGERAAGTVRMLILNNGGPTWALAIDVVEFPKE